MTKCEHSVTSNLSLRILGPRNMQTETSSKEPYSWNMSYQFTPYPCERKMEKCKQLWRINARLQLESMNVGGTFLLFVHPAMFLFWRVTKQMLVLWSQSRDALPICRGGSLFQTQEKKHLWKLPSSTFTDNPVQYIEACFYVAQYWRLKFSNGSAITFSPFPRLQNTRSRPLRRMRQ